VIDVLKEILGRFSREHLGNRLGLMVKLKKRNSIGDFRAVEIAPSIVACPAAKHAMGRSYLLREAPRLPLYGCTMPTTCSCKFRKNADRRDSDRRLLGATENNRWFGGVDGRTRGSRRSVEP
jgi:hypothetical protein